jgi:hypothetical protein
MTNEEHKAHLAALPEPVREAREALPCEASELLDYPRDLNDAAHEHADGSAEVIYHYQAHKLLAECSRSERAWAEESCDESGARPKSYDEYASLLAYYVVRQRYENEVREALEAYREAAQAELDAIADLPDVDGTDDEPRPTVAALQRDLGAIDTVLG